MRELGFHFISDSPHSHIDWPTHALPHCPISGIVPLVSTSSSLPAARRFGETTRTDSWWLPSAATFLGFTAFIVYSTWAGYSNAHYEFGPYLSPMYSPLLFGPSAHAWFGGPARPPWWPPFLHYSAAALIPGAPSGSGSPVTTTAAPTTSRSGPTLPAAPSVSRERRTGASDGFHSSFTTSIATSSTSQAPSSPCWPSTLEGHVVPDWDRRTCSSLARRPSSVSASEHSSSRRTFSSWAAIPSGAIPFATWSVACST